MPNQLMWLSQDNLAFPPTEQALDEPNGLLALGGDLSPERLIKAYQSGIFPWFCDEQPIMWWSPNPRAVIFLDDFRINRTLQKVINRKQYNVTINKAFSEVIKQCANAPFRDEDTWIVSDMEKAYCQLHELGYAHSIEVWHENVLVGGLYGIAIGGSFSGESMFYSAPNASKIALATLAEILKENGSHYIDCQIMNPFLKSMGAVEIERHDFIAAMLKQQHLTLPPQFAQ